MNSLISVIIPVYNTNQYLERCLDSIISNTYQKLEIICIDDGSSDNSLETLLQYESADPRLVVIAKENGGVSSARNAGLDIAHGDFVAFIDSDDYVHPQYFELLIRAQQASSADIVFCDHQVIEDDGSQIVFPSMKFECKALQFKERKSFFKNHSFRSFVWSKLFRKELIETIRFHEDWQYAEDAIFIADIWEKNPDIVSCFLPEVLYFYWAREDSLAHSASQMAHFKSAEYLTAKSLESLSNTEIYLEHAIRRLLVTRYMTTYFFPDKKIAKDCSRLLRLCISQLKKTDLLSPKMVVRYQAFCVCPRLYWLMRGVKEPGMIKWEIAERKIRREAKKQSQQQ